MHRIFVVMTATTPLRTTVICCAILCGLSAVGADSRHLTLSNMALITNQSSLELLIRKSRQAPPPPTVEPPGAPGTDTSDVKDQAQGFLSTVGGIFNQVKENAPVIKMFTDIVGDIIGLFKGNDELKWQKKKFEMEMKTNKQNMCFGLCASIEYGPWSPCSKPCNGGVRKRSRTFTLPEVCHSVNIKTCSQPAVQEEVCPLDCGPNGYPKGNGECQCQKGFDGMCCRNQLICPFISKPNVPGSKRSFSVLPPVFGAIAEFACPERYFLSGSDEAICLADGTWNGETPDCIVMKCDALNKPENGRLINGRMEYLVGDVVAFHCNRGYGIIGPEQSNCVSGLDARGRWSGFTPLCLAIHCDPVIPPINGNVDNTETILGTIVTSTCQPGFRLVGSDKRTCLASGRFSGHEARCELIGCENPYPVRNGILLTPKETYRVHEEIVYECEPGFRLEGDDRRKCIVDTVAPHIGLGGIWDKTAPKCMAADCGAVDQPANGAKDGSIYVFPNVVRFRCFPGYTMNGEPEIACGANTEWTAPPPTCEACPHDFFKDTQASSDPCYPCPPNSHTASVASSNVAQCLCNDGFKGNPGGPCVEINCPALTTPANGVLTCTGRKLGDTCELVCSSGHYMPSGAVQRTCLDSSQWTGTDPYCEPCPQNTYLSDTRSCTPCPRNSYTQGVGSSTAADCFCDSGFIQDNSGNCVDEDECDYQPCEDKCQNTLGSFECRCETPGYIVHPNDRTKCFQSESCRNLTAEQAPLDGGFVCHHFRLRNSKHCQVRCNYGFDYPSNSNDYETCSSATDFKWTMEIAGRPFEDCVPWVLPDYEAYVQVRFFATRCADLTEAQKQEVRQDFTSLLNRKKICNFKGNTLCNIDDVNIVCGDSSQPGRKKRSVPKADFSLKLKNMPLGNVSESECQRICKLVRMETHTCDKCIRMYSRYVRIIMTQTGKTLKETVSKRGKLIFTSANSNFLNTGEGNVAEKESCPDGSVKGKGDRAGMCDQCSSGFYQRGRMPECLECRSGLYQPNRGSSACLVCPSGTTSKTRGATNCQPCQDGFFGPMCRGRCPSCVHGKCDKQSGMCLCDSGYAGQLCDRDQDGCAANACYPGVTCADTPAPGIGFSCGSCPAAMTGDGSFCN